MNVQLELFDEDLLTVTAEKDGITVTLLYAVDYEVFPYDFRCLNELCFPELFSPEEL
jgi:hypothetical protein